MSQLNCHIKRAYQLPIHTIRGGIKVIGYVMLPGSKQRPLSVKQKFVFDYLNTINKGV